MEEEILQNSDTLPIDPAEASQVETASQPEEPIQKQLETERKESRQDRNWRRMENKAKDLERELQLQKEINEKLLRMPVQQLPQAQEVNELDTIPADEYLPKGKVEKLLERNSEKIRKQTLNDVEEMLKKRDQAQFMDHLKKKFPDFDEVVNPETLELLEDQEPELAKTIVASQDPFLIGLQSYKYIKALNLSQKLPESRRDKEVERKIKENSKTVPSPHTSDKRPMAQAYRMSEVEKKSIYEEMIGHARKAGFGY
jgi:hypothetical protein